MFLAIAIAVLYVGSASDIISRTEIGKGETSSLIDFLARMVVHAISPGFEDYALRIMLLGLAILGVASAGLAMFVFLRAGDQASNRQIAWLLIGYALYGVIEYFFRPFYMAGCCSGGAVYPAVNTSIELALLIFIAVAIARFLAIFPRAVDSESVHRTFFRRLHASNVFRDSDQPAERQSRLPKWFWNPAGRSVVLQGWHRNLVSGRLLWMLPVVGGAFFLVLLLVPLAWLPSSTFALLLLRGFLFVTISGSFVFFVFFGFPYAFASTTHLYRFGTEEERRRVGFLRAGIITFLLVGAFVTVAAIAAGFLAPTVTNINVPSPTGSFKFEITFAIMSLALLYWILLPSIAILSVSLAVLYRGALDPRVAISRITLWSFLGVFVTLVFLAVERFVALKLAQWITLPADTGAVVAGAFVAMTFVPVRNRASRGLTALAERWLPLDAVAQGERVRKVVAFADLSGYTALSARDEAGAMLQSALLKRQTEKVVNKHEGKLVKGMGDAVLLTFRDATPAVLAILELHESFPKAADVLGLSPLPLHSGLNQGEIVVARDGDIFGQTVNLAARLATAAAPGEVVCSDSVRLAALGEFSFEDLGSRSFKNVPGKVACFRVSKSA